MDFDERSVRGLAALARLELSDEELRATTRELERLLAYLARLQAIDVSGVEEFAHPGEPEGPLRADELRPVLGAGLATAGAPAVQDGMFAVPRVIPPADGGGDGP